MGAKQRQNEPRHTDGVNHELNNFKFIHRRTCARNDPASLRTTPRQALRLFRQAHHRQAQGKRDGILVEYYLQCMYNTISLKWKK